MLDLETEFTAGHRDLAEAILRAGHEDAASLALLEEATCARLAGEARSLSYRPARPVIGVGEAAVYQDFDLTTEFAGAGGLAAFARALDRKIAGACAAMTRNPLPDGFVINDLIVQRYPAGCEGISPHRDHIRYVGLVAIVVLAGQGRFFISQDRAGRGEREIPAPPGHLLLMRAPGFGGRRDRPFHAVREITEERYIFGLRYDSRSERWDA